MGRREDDLVTNGELARRLDALAADVAQMRVEGREDRHAIQTRLGEAVLLGAQHEERLSFIEKNQQAWKGAAAGGIVVAAVEGLKFMFSFMLKH